MADKIYVRHCMLFLLNFGKSAAETKKTIDEAFGEDSVGTSTIREWFAKLKKGDFDLKDKPRSGRPQEFDNDDLKVLHEEDPCQTTKELGEKLGVDHSTIVRRLHLVRSRKLVNEFHTSFQNATSRIV